MTPRWASGKFCPSLHPTLALVPTFTLLLPEPRDQQQSTHIWAPYLDYVVRIRKSQPHKEGRKIGAEEAQGWWVQSPGGEKAVERLLGKSGQILERHRAPVKSLKIPLDCFTLEKVFFISPSEK